MGCKRLTLLEKTLKSWRTLKKASLNRGFSLKNLDLVKVFLLTKNFTKSGLYCSTILSQFSGVLYFRFCPDYQGQFVSPMRTDTAQARIVVQSVVKDVLLGKRKCIQFCQPRLSSFQLQNLFPKKERPFTILTSKANI